MKTTTRQLRNSINRSLLRAFLLITLILGWLALSPHARAVCQEGCLTNSNTVLGEDALINVTTGSTNTAIGFDALSSTTTGGFNTATGNQALQNNTNGVNNTAHGNQALLGNTTGNSNTAVGGGALATNTTGKENTAVGASALLNNPGSANLALGFEAGVNLTAGNDNVYIANPGFVQESKRIHIGLPGFHNATFIAAISGSFVPGGVGVIVGSNGKLGTVVSSERFKAEIKPMDKASEVILALKPVTFLYKKEIDPESIPQFGLVAEEVEKVNPDLVARDADGKPYTVRYEAVNAMLLNEFLKEHRTVQEQKATIAQLKQNFAEQQKQIEALTAGLQKVSAQIELSKHAPQTVLNNQ
jgi:endosialidase-like protein